jgi:hypothetical protein
LRRPNDTREALLISLAQVSVPLLLGAQHLHHSALNDLIFQRGDPQRALASVRPATCLKGASLAGCAANSFFRVRS